MNSTMKICYFGAYSEYSKTTINKKGFEKNGVRIVDCSVWKPPVEFTSKLSVAFFIIVYPITLPFRNLFAVIKGLSLFLANPYDVIMVGYTGQFDVPAAFILSKITRTPVVLDAIFSSYDVFVNDRKLLKKNSIVARVLFSAEKMVYGLCDAVFVQSKTEKKFFEDTFGIPAAKVRVSYLGADDDI
ncbi:glycosyltransferase family 4 protein, partial [bacterium]|nr:glycosyltransferase family 4 protein [bacterium]